MDDMTERRLFSYGILILIFLFASEYSSRMLASFLSDKVLALTAYDVNCGENLIHKACEDGFHLDQSEMKKYYMLSQVITYSIVILSIVFLGFRNCRFKILRTGVLLSSTLCLPFACYYIAYYGSLMKLNLLLNVLTIVPVTILGLWLTQHNQAKHITSKGSG